MAHDFIQIDEFRRRAKAGEFASGKDAAPAVQASMVVSAAIDAETRQATYDISDATIDRSKDILNPDGGIFDNYTRNPVFLWAHDYSLLPIGKCVKGPWVEDGKVKATFQYHTAEKNPHAEMVWQQVLDGTLRAVSIGFVPIKWAFNEDRGLGIDFDEWELIETSQVPVPCNPNALLDDGKALASLEAFTKSMRAEIEARHRAKEQVMADKKIVTVAVEVDAADAEKVQAELTKKAKNLGATLRDATGAQADETSDDQQDALAGHVKAIGTHVKAMEKCVKGFGDALDTAQAHTKALGAMVDAMGDAMAQGDGKGFADALARALAATSKGAGPHALSAAQLGRVKSISKAASEIQAAHHQSQGASDGEPDDGSSSTGDDSKPPPDGDDESDDKGADPVVVAARVEAKRLGISVDNVISAWTKRALAQTQGRLD